MTNAAARIAGRLRRAVRKAWDSRGCSTKYTKVAPWSTEAVQTMKRATDRLQRRVRVRDSPMPSQ